MRRTAPQAKLHFAVCVASPARRENETIRKNPIPRDLLQQVREPQHPLQCARLVTGLVHETLRGLSGRRRHLQPLETAFEDVDGEDDVPVLGCPSLARLGAETR